METKQRKVTTPKHSSFFFQNELPQVALYPCTSLQAYLEYDSWYRTGSVSLQGKEKQVSLHRSIKTLYHTPCRSIKTLYHTVCRSIKPYTIPITTQSLA